MQKKLQLVNQVGVKVDYADGNLSLTNTGFMISPVTSVNGNIGDVHLTYNDVNALPDTYVAPVISVNNKTGDVTLSASDIGAATALEIQEVQNKIGDDSVSEQINNAVANKVDKVDGKGLSANDYTTEEKDKLSNIASGAEINQNAFSNITIGNTTIYADAKTDTLTFEAGSKNVIITPDVDGDKITIDVDVISNDFIDIICAD